MRPHSLRPHLSRRIPKNLGGHFKETHSRKRVIFVLKSMGWARKWGQRSLPPHSSVPLALCLFCVRLPLPGPAQVTGISSFFYKNVSFFFWLQTKDVYGVKCLFSTRFYQVLPRATLDLHNCPDAAPSAVLRGLGSQLPAPDSRLCPSATERLPASRWTSVCLGFPISEMGCSSSLSTNVVMRK